MYAPMHSRQVVVDVQFPQLAGQLQAAAHGECIQEGNQSKRATNQTDVYGERQAR